MTGCIASHLGRGAVKDLPWADTVRRIESSTKRSRPPGRRSKVAFRMSEGGVGGALLSNYLVFEMTRYGSVERLSGPARCTG